MTKIISIIVSILMAFMNLIIPAEKPFECETVKIKGVTYQNGFVPDNMHLKTHYVLKKDSLAHIVFHLPFLDYDTYYYLNEQPNEDFIWKGSDTYDNSLGKEHLFCPVEKWDYYHSYFEDSENYNFFLYERENFSQEYKKHDIQTADTEKYDQIIQFSVDNEYGSSTKNRAETISIPDKSYPEMRFNKESKDDLFSTDRCKYIIYKGNIYYYRYSNGGTGTMEVAILPDELEDYIISL
ncbi:MAG: hypothetical protein ACI4IX_08690, partial [Acutalibacteraceae bacterium]